MKSSQFNYSPAFSLLKMNEHIGVVVVSQTHYNLPPQTSRCSAPTIVFRPVLILRCPPPPAIP